MKDRITTEPGKEPNLPHHDSKRFVTPVAILLCAAFLLSAGLASAATATGWTVQQAKSALTAKATTFYTVNAGVARAPRGSIDTFSSVACQGAGKATAGRFGMFSCALAWTENSDMSKTAFSGTFWMRPWSANSICLTSISQGACPPPLPAVVKTGDPRQCPSANGDLAHCVSSAVHDAAAAQLRATGKLGVNYACVATAAWTVYKCSGLNGNPLTVAFVAGKTSWTVKVA